MKNVVASVWRWPSILERAYTENRCLLGKLEVVDAEVLAAAVQRRRLSWQGVPLSFEGHFRRFVSNAIFLALYEYLCT